VARLQLADWASNVCLVEGNFVSGSCSLVIIPFCDLLREGAHDLNTELWFSIDCFQVVDDRIIKLESKFAHRLSLAIAEPARKGSPVYHTHVDTRKTLDVLGITGDSILESLNRSIIQGPHACMEINNLIASFSKQSERTFGFQLTWSE